LGEFSEHGTGLLNPVLLNVFRDLRAHRERLDHQDLQERE
jgi:hypothetical protein